MKQVGIKQARRHFSDLIERVEAGEEFIISRQGRAVAQLIPALKTLKQLPTLSEFRRGIGLVGSSSVRLLRTERDDW